MSDENYYVEGPVPETPEPGEYPSPWTDTEVVGTRRPRVDAYERVSGAARYPSDIVLPDMLYGAILRCPHAHARITKLDLDPARDMPGVAAVLSDADPEARLSWPYGQGESSPLFVRDCLFEGEVVAAVAAETPHQARDALRAIRVEYEVLPHVSDHRTALAEDAPHARQGGNRQGEVEIYSRGDVEAGFAAADVVLEEEYSTPYEIHNPMELHGAVARWDGNRLMIWESLQGVFSSQARLASVLGLPLANVTVSNPYMGGGFGSKLNTSKHTVIAALLARKTARPVKLFLSREEEQLVTGNRPGVTMRLKAGVTKDGTLTALEFHGVTSAGAYPGGGAGLNDWQIRDLYACDNVRCTNEWAFINAGPSRPFRAPGHPQGSWALEQMMDALADAIDMDPVELRLANITTVSQARGNQPYTSTGLRECLVEGAKAFGWKAESTADPGSGHLRRGVGVAACSWIVGGGGPPSTVIVKMFSDGSVNLNMGASDIGTGTKTWAAMIVAEELDVPVDEIQIENADTAATQYATPSGGSKTVPTESPAVREAAYRVREELIGLAAAQLGVDPEALTIGNGRVVKEDDPDSGVAFGDIEGLRRRGVVVGVGYRGANPEGKVVNPFAAQFCEVEVNTRTGEIRVLRFLGAHDSGRVLNRLTYDNQVFGGIAMGIGFGMTEERILDAGQTGKMVNISMHDYKIPTMMDVPADMTSVPIDPQDHEANTTSAKGLGEPVTIPTAAAIANAVYHATGVRVTHTPLNPIQTAALLAANREA
ncbi:MAG: xanthine dehydrogenase family protein molybdopterin-binding subunit [Holophagae bacterium]|jgi:xanthine dehydrogenase YagR molybdenum-binding subunit